jgi:hypothetical protein
MKHLWHIALLLLSASACVAAEPDAWLRSWPQGATGQDVPPDQITEIPHSLFEYAEDLLKNEPYFHIGEGYFPGFSYACQSGTSAYLVRALYERPSTGTFNVKQHGHDLLVRHYALGPRSVSHRSALVVCLGFEPEQVYVATGGAL